MTTAFVLSGGGSLGSVQVGMLLALADRGITPDLLVGSSVGAVNATWTAGRPGAQGARQLAEIWRSVKRENVFPVRPLAGLIGFLGRSDHLVPPDPLRSLLARHLGYERLEDAHVRVEVIATEVTTGFEAVLDRGDVVDAVAASAAIPGVFPPVRIDGRDLMDGGVSDNTPVSRAVEAGADRIYVMPTGYACALDEAPRSALAMVLQAITLLVQQRLIADVARYQSSVDLRVLPPLCPLHISPVDFSHTAELINRAHESASRWLDRPACDKDQTSVLSLHRHDPT